MKINVRPSNKNYVFVETSIFIDEYEHDEVVFLTGTNDPTKEPTNIYIIEKNWWEKNKRDIMYQNRIKIA